MTPRETISRGDIPEIRSPSNSIVPPRVLTRPEMVRRRVVFPWPLGPKRPNRSPCGTMTEAPWRTSTPPYPALTSVTVNIGGLPPVEATFAQVCRDDPWILRDCLGLADGEHLPGVEDHEPIRDSEENRKNVLDDQDCDAGV